MKVSKRILALLLSVLLLLPSFVTAFAVAEGETEEPATPVVTYPNADPDEPYYVVGYFQEKGTKVEGGSTVSENTGDDAETYPNKVSMGDVRVTAATPIDLTGRNAADLALVLDITYTRSDGVTGDGKLDKTGNQMLFVNRTVEANPNTNVAQLTGSPYLTGFTTNYANAAGKTVTYMIPWNYVHTDSKAFVRDTAATTVDNLLWQVYNDSWKVDIDGNGKFDDAFGVNVAIENARIVDVTRDGEGYKHGIVMDFTGLGTVENSYPLEHTPNMFPWAGYQTNSITAEMKAADLKLEFDVMYGGQADPLKIKNGEIRFEVLVDGAATQYKYNGWGNDKISQKDTWYHFEFKLSDFYRDVKTTDADGKEVTNKVYDLVPANIQRMLIFNYNDDKTVVNANGEGATPLTTKVKNLHIVDTTVTAARDALEVAVNELKNCVFDENEKAVAYDAAVAAGEALLADYDADPAAMTEAAAAIATAKAELTNIVDMSEDVVKFSGHGSKTVADVTRNQYYYNWSAGDGLSNTNPANITDGTGTNTIAANHYFQLTVTLQKNAAYTGESTVTDLSTLLKNVQVRFQAPDGARVDGETGESRSDSFTLSISDTVAGEDEITYTMEVLLNEENQGAGDRKGMNWEKLVKSIIFVNLNQDLRADGTDKNADIPVYCTLSDVKIVNKTAAVLKEELATAANASVEEYEENDALTAYTEKQAEIKAELAGMTIREVKAAATELATLKSALTEKPEPVDKTALNEAIAAGETALADETKDYTVDTETALQNAIDTAKALTDAATQEEVDAAAKAITDAIAALKEVEPEPEPVVNKEALTAKITEATTALNDETKDYTEATATALQNAITAAQAVVDAADATQDAVDAQVTALTDAIAALVDLAPLNEAVEAGEAKLADGKNYTADTKAALKAAVDAAATADTTTQAAVDAAAKAITDAIDALVIDPIEYIPIPLEDAVDGEATSEEAHGLWVYGALSYMDENDVEQYTPINLTPYIGSELSISFKIRINATENLPEAAGEEANWIKYIRNGSMLLYTDMPASDAGKWASGEHGDYKLICGAAGNLMEDASTTDFVEVTIPVPQSVIDAGQITGFSVLMYNDLHALLGGSADVEGAKGATITVKDAYLIVDSTNKVDKTTLEEAINAMLTDDELAEYTASSVAKYKALYDAAKAVLDDENATTEQVVEQVNILKTAAGVLVEDMSEGGEIIMVDDEMTSAVQHYLSVNKTFEVPVNFAKYGERESLKLSFDIRVNKDEATFPEVLAEVTDAEWIQYIKNGSIIIWTEGTTDEYKSSLNQQTPPIVLNCAKVGDLLETAIVGVYSNVTIDLPAEIVAAGTISKIEIFLYNDLNGLNAEAGNENGVTISVKDIKLVMGAQVAVDKTELQAAVDAEITDLTGYTAESVAAYQAAMTAAKAVLADDAATSAQVAEALAALEAAVLVPAGDYSVGNVDGQGEVTTADALLALQIATGKVVGTEDQLLAANVNGSVDEDGNATVTVEDALIILQYATKTITVFPVETQMS